MISPFPDSQLPPPSLLDLLACCAVSYLWISWLTKINQVLCCAHLPPTVYSLAILVLVNIHISKAAAASSLEPLIWNHTLRNTNIYICLYMHQKKKSSRIKNHEIVERGYCLFLGGRWRRIRKTNLAVFSVWFSFLAVKTLLTQFYTVWIFLQWNAF